MDDGIFFSSITGNIPTERIVKIDDGKVNVREAMEQHDWTTVTVKKRAPRTELHDETPPPKKRVNPESIQALIRKRMELRLSQEKADQLCYFPKQSFKEIESHQTLPNLVQQYAIQQHFGIQLKIDHT